MAIDEDACERMNEYRELAEYVHQLRDNVLAMDDQLQKHQWVAAGGRGAANPAERNGSPKRTSGSLRTSSIWSTTRQTLGRCAMASDPRRRDPRVCSACGEPVDAAGTCAAIRTMLAGVEDLSERGDQRAA